MSTCVETGNNHKLMAHSSVMLKDGRNPLVVYCYECGRQWSCESINFAPMGQPPKWVPGE